MYVCMSSVRSRSLDSATVSYWALTRQTMTMATSNSAFDCTVKRSFLVSTLCDVTANEISDVIIVTTSMHA